MTAAIITIGQRELISTGQFNIGLVADKIIRDATDEWLSSISTVGLYLPARSRGYMPGHHLPAQMACWICSAAANAGDPNVAPLQLGPEGAAGVDEALAHFAKNSTSCSAPVIWILQCAVDGGIPGGDYSAVPKRPKLELVKSGAD